MVGMVSTEREEPVNEEEPNHINKANESGSPGTSHGMGCVVRPTSYVDNPQCVE
jgi:hypothetical protein